MHVVPGATLPRVVNRNIDRRLLAPFIGGARMLEQEGVAAITTSCGFLVLFQDELAAQVKVPFFASSLLQIPLVRRMVRGSIGVITADARALSPEHLRAAGADGAPVYVAGLEECPAFSAAILRQTAPPDVDVVTREVVSVSEGLLRSHPDIGAFVFECHNLAPYAPAVQRATGRPIFDIFSLIALTSQAVAKPSFS
jgi:hypothetical protein